MYEKFMIRKKGKTRGRRGIIIHHKLIKYNNNHRLSSFGVSIDIQKVIMNFVISNYHYGLDHYIGAFKNEGQLPCRFQKKQHRRGRQKFALRMHANGKRNNTDEASTFAQRFL